MSEDDPLQMPAARLSDRHVDDVIAASERSEWRRQRQASRRAMLGRLGRSARWLIANAKDILGALGLVTAVLAFMTTAGWIDPATWPTGIRQTVLAMREVFS